MSPSATVVPWASTGHWPATTSRFPARTACEYWKALWYAHPGTIVCFPIIHALPTATRDPVATPATGATLRPVLLIRNRSTASSQEAIEGQTERIRQRRAPRAVDHSGMRVLIAGCGIGGLTAALMLQRAGIEVQLFEQAQ